MQFNQFLLDVIQGTIDLVHGPGRVLVIIISLLPDVFEFFLWIGDIHWVSFLRIGLSRFLGLSL